MDFDDEKNPLNLRFNQSNSKSESQITKTILKYNKHSRIVFLLMSLDNPSAVWLGGLLFSGTTYSMLESPIIQGRFLG